MLGWLISSSQRRLGPLDGGRTPGRIASQPGAAATVDMSFFPPGIPLNQTGTFSLLGAPIGDGSFCNQFTTSERVAKALPLLDALAVLPDAQTALLLLRHCASHCRMAYSIRVAPPDGLGPSLEAFGNAVRGCLEVACSGPLTAEAWLQATLSTRCGGLGLRSVARHSVAGYAASLWATAPLCKDMDPGYDPDFNAALNLVNMALPPADHLPVVTRAGPCCGRQARSPCSWSGSLSGASSALAARRRGSVAPCSPKRRLGASRGDPALSDHGSLAAPLAGV